MQKFLILFLAIGMVVAPGLSAAQTLHQDEQGLFRAEVLVVVEEGQREVVGIGVMTHYQILSVRFLEGPEQGEVVEIENDLFEARVGQKIFINYLETIDGEIIYSISEPDRRPAMAGWLALFVLAVLILSGWQGARALFALLVSFAAIFYLLLPKLVAGGSPVVWCGLIAVIILAFAIVFTHGFNRESAAALIGTSIAIALTSVLAYLAVRLTSLSGFIGDEATFLNLNTGGTLDFRGLLLGAIIIGVVGVLDDIAVTQAATVAELHDSAKNLSKKELYLRALRVGREHVGALVNTLVFAYTGAALPLLLLFSMSATDLSLILNREIFATEIIRTIIGSIGLIMTVPITTYVSVIMLYGHDRIKGGVRHHHHH
jgi:uncharacterized membrane protein